jgi:hypothetical protein
MTRAISSSTPKRPSGTRWGSIALNAARSAGGRPSLTKAALSTGPGLTELTRTPRGASSTASARTIASKAPFVAVYTEKFGAPTWLPTDVRKMTDPAGPTRGEGLLQGEELTLDVDGEVLVVGGLVDLLYRQHPAAACVEDDGVDPAEPCPKFVGDPVCAGDPAGIGLQHSDFRRQGVTCAGEGSGVVSGNQHAVATLVKLQRGREADASGAASHQGDGIWGLHPRLHFICVVLVTQIVRCLFPACQEGFVVSPTE